MSRVKFNVNTEYAYLQNFKVLQSMSRKPNPGPRQSPIFTCLTFVQTSLPAMA